MNDHDRRPGGGPAADAALRRDLRRLDPAAALTPLDRGRLTALLEDIVTIQDTTQVGAAREAGTVPDPGSRRLRLGLGLVGVAAAGAALFGFVTEVGSPDDSGAVAAPGPAAVTELADGPAAGPGASCPVLTPEALAGSELAFAGTVTSVAGGTVTLAVTDRYTGAVADLVQVPQGDPDQVVDGSAPVYEDGRSYLLTATGGVVGTCGVSGPDTPELRALYDQAFGR